MSELVDCINSLSAKDIIKSATKTANGTPFYLQTSGGAAFIAEYQAIYDAYTGTIPDTAQAGAQNTLVKTLVDANLWSTQHDLFYVIANGDSPNCLLNWMNPATFTLTPVHSPLFTPWEGITGDGDGSGAGNDYLDTGWDPITDRVNFQANGSYGVYVRNNTQDDGYTVGVESSAGSRLLFRPRTTADTASAFINASGSMAYGNTAGAGMWIINRTAANATELWQNKISRDTDTDAYAAMSTRDVKLLAWDDEGVLKNYSLSQISVFFIGAALNQAKVDIITDAIETYMDFLGTGVA